MALFFASQYIAIAPDEGKPGGPIPGLTAQQLKRFYEARKTFERMFTPLEGLGPLYNAESCAACHQFDPHKKEDGDSSLVTAIGRRSPEAIQEGLSVDKIRRSPRAKDVDPMERLGGPYLATKSITTEFPKEFPADCLAPPSAVPTEAEFIGRRQPPTLMGSGLIDAVPDEDLDDSELDEMEQFEPTVGRVIDLHDPLTNQTRPGRFGWKDQYPNLLHAVATEMNLNLGLTTAIRSIPKSARGKSEFPDCLVRSLPLEPNDSGKILVQLNYYLSLLAPPVPLAPTPQTARGRKMFDQINCAACHRPTLRTAPVVHVVDPDSNLPKLSHLEIAALEKQQFNAYTDLLVHNMGAPLSDGIPDKGATGAEWRTPPLWGLRFRTRYMHDGRTRDLREAIMLHDGQGLHSKKLFEELKPDEQTDLLAFLRSL
jgi:CxxC motif-containing protein (DUF1111 family)